jgi:hypothetical protein
MCLDLPVSINDYCSEDGEAYYETDYLPRRMMDRENTETIVVSLSEMKTRTPIYGEAAL